MQQEFRMTLLTTEIHRHDDPKNASIVFAADRRISNAKTGSYIGTQKKIFELPWLKAAIGYFGLTEVSLRGKNRPMRDWLQVFIRQNFSSSSMADAGFIDLGKPEFWFVRNVDDAGNPTLGQYETRGVPTARCVAVKDNETQIYRNGDIRAHIAVWEKIDDSFGLLLNLNGFSKVRHSKD
jgi:hypothetical protein